MLITDLPTVDVAALRTRLPGEVYGPADAGYDGARRPWNLAVDQRPAAVALPVTDSDVQAIVDFARTEGLHVAAQATGHGASALASLDRTILISTGTCAACASTPARADRPRPRRRASGRTSPVPPPPTASLRWPARRATSASSATRSAAG